MAFKVLEVEITKPLPTIRDLEAYSGVYILVKMHGIPFGCLNMGARRMISRDQLAHAISTCKWWDFTTKRIYNDILDAGRKRPSRPFISVLVCTRDRTDSLKDTLDSLRRLNYPRFEVIVVDNAPSDERTRQLAKEYPFRYVVERRPGLDWARNRGIAESRGKIVAYIDDDEIADPLWLTGLADGFADREVMCVTGLVFPAELETDAQMLFEFGYGGFGRGYLRTEYRPGSLWKYQVCSPSIGTGGNMAFRKEVFDKVGMFDVAFDVGTPTGGSGDLEMFHRLMRNGCAVEYRPEALVFHRHRKTIDELRKQLGDYGKSFVALQTKSFIREPDARFLVVKFMMTKYFVWHLRRIIRGILRREYLPLDLILAELRGCVRGPFAYLKSRRKSRRILRDFPLSPDEPGASTLVRKIEITEGVRELRLGREYSSLNALITYNGVPLGDVTINTCLDRISARTLREHISTKFADRIVQLWMRERSPSKPSSSPSVAVVIPAARSSESLHRCLQSACDNTYPNKTVILVDNGSDSEATRAVADKYGVTYLKEKKVGANFARNAGIRASDAEIIAFMDDDCIADPNWLNAIVEGFESDPSIASVAGLIMPYELETEAQRLFEEEYGGMRRGYERLVYDRFTLPLSQTGGTGIGGNIAFRSSVLKKVGLLDEALCPGVPSKCGEEPDIYYRLLRHGYKILYEPKAIVWHSHRRDMKELKRQLASYSTGAYAYLTKCLLEYREPGALRVGARWFLHYHCRNLILGLLGKSRKPPSFTLAEIGGAVRGPLAYLQAKAHVSRIRLSGGLERRGKPESVLRMFLRRLRASERNRRFVRDISVR